MHESFTNLLMASALIAPVAAYPYSQWRRIGYPAGLFACSSWALILIGLLLLNYRIADSLGMRGNHGSDWDVSGFGMIAQMLFLIEIPLILWIKRRLVGDK